MVLLVPVVGVKCQHLKHTQCQYLVHTRGHDRAHTQCRDLVRSYHLLVSRGIRRGEGLKFLQGFLAAFAPQRGRVL